MGFVSFLGRLFFSTIFVLAAWQKINDFGSDGGTALKGMEPKLEVFKNHLQSTFGLSIPSQLETKYLLIAAIALEGLGGILFTIGNSVGAYLLLIFLASATPIMHDFYNYDPASQEFTQEFIQFMKNLSLFGGLLFFLGLKGSAARQAPRRRKVPSKVKTT